MQKMLKDFGHSSFLNIYDKLVFFVVIFLIIKVYGIEAYGNIEYAISVSTLIFVVACLEKTSGLVFIRDIAKVKSKRIINNYMWNFLYLKSIITIPFFIILTLILYFLKIDQKYFIFLFSVMYLQEIIEAPMHLAFCAKKKFRQFGLTSNLRNSVFLVLCLTSIYYKLDLSFFFYSFIISQFFDIYLSWKLFTKEFFKPKPVSIDFNLMRKFIYNGFFFLISYISTIVSKNIIVIIISILLGNFQLGLFLIAYKVIEFSITIYNSILSVVFTHYSSIKNKEVGKFGHIFNGYSFILTITIGLLIFFISDPIINFFFGSGFNTTIITLKLLSLQLIFNIMSNNLVVLLQSQFEERILSAYSVINSIVIAVLAYVFIDLYGILGAAYALILASVIRYSFLYIVSYRYFDKNKRLRRNVFSKLF